MCHGAEGSGTGDHGAKHVHSDGRESIRARAAAESNENRREETGASKASTETRDGNDINRDDDSKR